jgi:N,N-dimethylformamidase
MIHDPEALVGYAERPSYRAGDRVELKVSSSGTTACRLVRLRHGDTNPAGPGLLQDVVGDVSTFAGTQQSLRPGSYLVSSAVPLTPESDRWSMTAWVWPTLATAETAIMSVGDTDRWVALVWNEAGALGVNVGSTPGGVHTAWTAVQLRARRWQLVTLTVDHRSGIHSIRVYDAGEVVDAPINDLSIELMTATVEVLTAARHSADGPTAFFNGKIEAPALWGGAITRETLARFAEADEVPGTALYGLDFAKAQSEVVISESVNARDARMINMATRGVTGRRWAGQVESWAAAPELYAAIHFHDDDLGDAGWQTSCTITLPPDAESGIYAAWLTCGDYEDWVTFIVTRPVGRAPKRLAVLIPTLTYLAYANEPIFQPHIPMFHDRRDDFTDRHALVSQYNWHTDGSGVVFASWRRPMLNLRPDYRYWLTGHPHGPGLDLYLLHWLDEQGLDYDLISDHQLHDGGVQLLEDYPVLLTGAHPEYWTVPMLDALDEFQSSGGRLGYLGGNGLAGVVGIHPVEPHVSEMRRRGNGVGLWDADPGESHLVSDGNLGGTTRHHALRGRELIGVDIVGMGFAEARPYIRTDDGRDARVEFVFAGVDETIIGDFGLHMGGAVGYEVDSADKRSGTPPHALVIASCDTIPPNYVQTEQRGVSRADMVFFETPAGGAVFSTSSITWTGSLSHDDGRNAISRITRNVIDRFLDPTPFHYSRTLNGSEQR